MSGASTTLDEAVAVFERELPNWWWSVCRCWVSCHGTCGPDWVGNYRNHPDYGIEPFDVEIMHPTTPAEVLLAMVEKAKAFRAAREIAS